MLLAADLPGDDLASAQAVDLSSGAPQAINEQIGDGLHGDLDVDIYQVSLAVGDTLTADVDAYQLDDGSQLSSLDGYLRLFDSSGSELVYNSSDAAADDYSGYYSSNYYDPYLSFVASSSGTYYVAVSGEYNTYYDPATAGSGYSGSTGAYELTLLAEPNVPDVPGDQLSDAQAVSLTPDVAQTFSEEVGDGLYDGQDVDIYQVSLSAGDTLKADVDAYYLDDGSNLSSLDGYLRLFDASGSELAYNYSDAADDDDSGYYSSNYYDPYLSFVASASGTYYIAVSGESNTYYDATTAGSGYEGSTGAYELTLLAEPSVPDVPGDQLSDAQAVSLTPDVPQTFSEEVGDGLYHDLDVDIYEVSLATGDTLKADIDAYQLDDGSNLSNLDSYLRLFDASGSELAYNYSDAAADDYSGYSYSDAYLSFVASVTGTYYIAVSGEYNTYYDATTAGSGSSGSTGAYELTLLAEPNVPDVPGDQLSTAQAVNLTPGVSQTLSEEVGNGLYDDRDVDLYAVSLVTGQSLSADVDAYYLDDGSQLSSLDSYLRVFDGAGTELAYSDDATSSDDYYYSSVDPYVSITAASTGTYYVAIAGYGNYSYDPTIGGSGSSGEMGAYQLTLLADDPPEPTLGFETTDLSVDENAGSVVFTVTLSDASNNTITVDYGTANGSATAGEDYTATSGTLTFNPNETSKTVSVSIIDNGTEEADESFYLNLSAATGANLGTSQATATIADDDAPVIPSLDFSNTTLQTDEGSGSVVFTVVLSSATSQTVTVDYATGDVSATAGDDYTATTGTLTFAPNVTSETITVPITDDADDETDEDFQLTLSSATNATIGTAQATATILDNDEPLPDANITTTSVAVDEDAGTASFTVTLSIAVAQTVTVDYTTSDLSAVAGEDYTTTTDTLTFNPNETAGTISIPIIDDTTDEADETFRLTLLSATNATLGTTIATATITDNDLPPADGPGDDLSSAQVVSLTDGVSQTISADIGDGSYGDSDVDLFEIWLTAGQELKADVDAYKLNDGSNLSNLDSYLRLFDSSGTELTYNYYDTAADDYTGSYGYSYNYYDAYVSFVASLEGTYYIGVSGEYNTSYDPTTGGSATSGSTGAYELTLLAETKQPDVPGDQLDTAQSVTLTAGVAQTISEEIGNGLYDDLDVDLFAISLTAGQTLSADVDAYLLDDGSSLSSLDSYLRLFDASGSELAYNYSDTAADDYSGYYSSNYYDPYLSFVASVTGTFYVAVSDEYNTSYDPTTGGSGSAGSTGAYELTLLAEDPPLPSVDFQNATLSVDEDGVTATLTVTLSSSATNTVTVDYATSDGSATAGADYASTTGTLTFLNGEVEKTITVSITDDTTEETAEDFSVSLSSPTNATLGTSQATVTIQDNDTVPLPTVELNATTASVSEGAGSVVLTVVLSSASAQTVTVDFATSDASAIAGADYTSTSGTLTFSPNETTGAITVPIVDDGDVESDETFQVALSAPVNATLGESQATVTIQDDEPPPPTVGFSDTSLFVDEDAGTVAFTVTLSAASAQTVTVDYATSDESATAGDDYTSTTGTLTFNPDETTATIDVAIADDADEEANESFRMTLSSPTGGVLGLSEATATITDNDDDPPGDVLTTALTVTLSPDTAQAFDQEIGDGPYGYEDVDLYEVTLAAGQTLVADVDAYQLDDGNWLSSLDGYLRVFDSTGSEVASNGVGTSSDDYTGYYSSNYYDPYVSFVASVAGTYYIAVSDEYNSSYDPTVAGNRSSGSTGAYQLTLLADTPPVPIDVDVLVDNVSVNEGDQAVFTISLAAASANTLTLTYQTVPGSATTVVDYSAVSGSVTFAPGELQKSVPVDTYADIELEPDETFDLVVSGYPDVTVTGTATITEDLSDLPDLLIQDMTVTEGGTAAFTVGLSESSPYIIHVAFGTSGSTATADADYWTRTQTVTFAPGELQKPLTVFTRSDLEVEGDETLQLDLSGPGDMAASAIMTIQDDPANIPALSVADVTVTEGETATFAVTLLTTSANWVYVDYEMADATAVAGEDFAGSTGTLVFAPSETEQVVNVKANSDLMVEADETFTFQVTGPAGNTAAATGTIQDDPSNVPTVALGDVTVIEGAQVVFNVTLSAPSTNWVYVGYETANDSATGGLDFTSESGTLSFAPGQTEKPLPISTNADLEVEGDEIFTLTVTGPAGDSATATATVQDDLTNIPTLSVADVSATEGQLAVFTVALSAASTSWVYVDYQTTPGTASAEDDYAPATGKLIFAPGQLEQEVLVATSSDLELESDETFTLDLSGPAGTSATATGTIVDDPTNTPAIFVSDVTVTEGGEAVFTVTLSGPSSNWLQIDYTAVAETAASPSDFGAVIGAVLLPPGETETTVTVNTYSDLEVDADETFRLELTGPASTTASATGTIVDDPQNIPTVLASDVTVVEGGEAVFTVTLSGPSNNPVHVTYSVAAGTDVTTSDVRHICGIISFAPGETTQTVTIDTFSDLESESDETFTLQFTGPAGATATATGTVQDDPGNIPSLIVGDISATEGEDLVFTVTLSGPSDDWIYINYTTVIDGGGGGEGEEPELGYQPVSGTLVFEPGDTEGTITVPSFTDLELDANETFTLELSGPGGMSATATGTVVDDPSNIPGLLLSDATAEEGNSAIFTVTLTGPSNDWVYVNYQTVDGTATAGADYAAAGGTLAFEPNGLLVRQVSVAALSDYDQDPDETYTFEITGPGGTSATATATITDTTGDATAVDANDNYSVHHSDVLTILDDRGVLANDGLPSGPMWESHVVDYPTTGTLTLGVYGSVNYIPDDVGTFTFTYEVTDDVGTPYAGPITAAIEVWNYRPVGRDDYYRVQAGSTLTVGSPTDLKSGVLINDWDDDGDDITATIMAWPANGTLTPSTTPGAFNGAFTYTPDAGFVGTDSFLYEVSDPIQTGGAYEDSWSPGGYIYVEIDVWDGTPVAQDDSFRVFHDTTLNEPIPGILENDWDPEGDALTINWDDSTITNGVLNENTDGSFEYIPNPGFVGTETFTYTLTDGTLESTAATATIEVWNHIPEPNDNSYTVHSGQTLTVAKADGFVDDDFEWDPDTITAVDVTQPAHGLLTPNADGSFTYAPTADADGRHFAGTDSFTYKVTDGAQQSDPATVTINLQNSRPYAYDQVHFVHANTTLNVSAADGVVEQGEDPDNDPSPTDSLTAYLITGVDPLSGTLTFADDGSFDFIPEQGFVGEVSFTFGLDDDIAGGDGSDDEVPRDQGTVTIHVTNEAPWALDDSYQTDQSVAITAAVGDPDVGSVLDNDFDDDGPNTPNDPDDPFDDNDSLTAILVTPPEHHMGTFELAVDGTFTYTPEPDFVGVDSFTYEVFDGTSTSEIAAAVIEVRTETPVAVMDLYEVERDKVLNVGGEGVMENDIVAIGKEMPTGATKASLLKAIQVEDDTDPETDPVYGPENGTVVLNDDGTFTYTPNPGFDGVDYFTYKLEKKPDGPESDETTVTILVNPPQMIAHGDEYVCPVGTTLTVSATDGVLKNDEYDDPVKALPAEAAQYGTVTLNDDGSFNYVPGPEFNDGTVSQDTFQYKIYEHDPSDKWATVTIQRLDLGADDASFSIKHDRNLTGSLPFGSTDTLGNPVSASAVSNPTSGTLTLQKDGTFRYEPNAGFVGTDTFTYEITNGKEVEGPATVTIEVTNEAPIANGSHYTTGPQEPVAGWVQGNASDADGDDLQGILVAGVPTSDGIFTWNDGSFTFTPDATFQGTTQFTYKMNDGVVDSAVQTVTIDVNDNAPWAASGHSYSVYHDQTLNVSAEEGVLVGAGDELPGQLKADKVSSPPNASSFTLNTDGSFDYTPASGFTGTDTFTFKVIDPAGNESEERTVDIDVWNMIGVEPWRAIPLDRFYGDGCGYGGGYAPITGDVLDVTTDIDGDTIWAELVSAPEDGTFVFDPSGDGTFTYSDGYGGMFTFEITDGMDTSGPYEVWLEYSCDWERLG